jgi:drug/metabolite transporter (DMT)-like permease
VPIAAWVAAGAAVVGTAGMNGGWDASPDPLGVAAGAGAALSFAGYLLVGERLGTRLPGLTATAWGFAVSAVIWLVLVPPELLTLDGGTWTRLAWVGVFGTAAPFLLEMAALRMADPGRVGVVATAEPVVAAAVAWPVLGQALGPIQLIGGGFVVAGVATVQWFAHAATPDVPPTAV